MKNLSKCQETMIMQQETLFHYLYHQNYHKLIGTDLSRQTNTSIPQQNGFVQKLEENGSAAMFFIAEK